MVHWIHKTYSNCPKSALQVLAETNLSITLSIFILKSWWICINVRNDDLSLFMVNRTYVFNRHTTLNNLSAVLLVTIDKIVSIEGYSTGHRVSHTVKLASDHKVLYTSNLFVLYWETLTINVNHTSFMMHETKVRQTNKS